MRRAAAILRFAATAAKAAASLGPRELDHVANQTKILTRIAKEIGRDWQDRYEAEHPEAA